MVSKAREDFPEPDRPGEDDHGVARQVQVHVAQVVLAGALDDQAGKVRAQPVSGGTGSWTAGGSTAEADINGWFFSYGFRHALMLIENFFEYPFARRSAPRCAIRRS